MDNSQLESLCHFANFETVQFHFFKDRLTSLMNKCFLSCTSIDKIRSYDGKQVGNLRVHVEGNESYKLHGIHGKILGNTKL